MDATTPGLGADLHGLVRLIDRAAARVLGPGGEVTYRRYSVLTAIAQLGAPTQHEVAERLGASDAAVSRMLANLTAAGLVETTVDPAHRRRNVVGLTPAGAAAEARVGARLGDGLARMVAAAGVDEEAFHGEVTRLREAFRSWLAAPEPESEPVSEPASEPASRPASTRAAR